MRFKRWIPFAAAALVLGVAACASIGSTKGNDSSGGGGAAAAPTVTTGPPPSATDGPTTTIAEVPLSRTLGVGSTGDDVTRLQQRMHDLGYDPGPVDGQFGSATQSAVWAFQKLVQGLTGKDITGKVTPETWDKMEQPEKISPLRPNATATHLEIYLPSQTAVLFDNNKVRLVTHISSGTGKEWCENGYCSVAITPGGVYKFGRRVDGWDDSVLGQLYNPVYFNYGVAVHGAYNVPLYPASHACVRIPMHIAEYFPTLVKRGDDVFVFDGKKDPEAYGAQPPPFNTKDPNATTTTQATSTTVAKSTTTTAKSAATTTPTTVPTPATTAPAPTTTAATTTVPAPTTTVAASSG